jgi:CheY-like chemotaxis protein
MTSNIPIIVVSGHAFEEDITKAYELGAAGYVVKPIHRADLLNAIAKSKGYLHELK